MWNENAMEQPRVRMSPELMAVKSSPEKAGPAWAGGVSRRMPAKARRAPR